MSWSSDLVTLWHSKAEDLRRYGASEAGSAVEACAEELEEHLRQWELEALTLDEAAEESGYSRDHLGRLLSDGVVLNVGEPYSPRVRRRDLPRKPGHLGSPALRVDDPVPSKVQMARSVVNSD